LKQGGTQDPSPCSVELKSSGLFTVAAVPLNTDESRVFEDIQLPAATVPSRYSNQPLQYQIPSQNTILPAATGKNPSQPNRLKVVSVTAFFLLKNVLRHGRETAPWQTEKTSERKMIPPKFDVFSHVVLARTRLRTRPSLPPIAP